MEQLFPGHLTVQKLQKHSPSPESFIHCLTQTLPSSGYEQILARLVKKGCAALLHATLDNTHAQATSRH